MGMMATLDDIVSRGDVGIYAAEERAVFGDPQPAITRPAAPLVPTFVRADGGVRIRLGAVGGATHVRERAERGGFRVRFPRNTPSCEAVLINTGGGLAGGDRMTLDVALDGGARAVVTTQAAEKVYRAQSTATTIDAAMRLGEASALDWLPQETILFSGSRLARTLSVDMPASATLTAVESVVFGRVARGEVMEQGFLHDRWRVRRDGRLVFADDLRLDGDVAELLAAKAAGDGARALATVLHVGRDAQGRLDAARDLLKQAASECGASAWDGVLVMRFLSRDPQRLREDLVGVLQKFRHAAMPRSWQC